MPFLDISHLDISALKLDHICDPSAQNQSQVVKHKMAENCILSKNVKKVIFFVFIKTTFFEQDSFKIFVVNIILQDFSSICGFFES